MSRRSKLPSAAIMRPIGTAAIGSVVVVLGLFFLTRLSVDLLPTIVYPQIRASVNYPGVAPEVMEEQVTKVLETALATTEDVIRIESETQEGRASVSLHFRYGTNIDFALQDASKNLDRARGQLPVDVRPPTIFKFDPSQVPVFEVGFSSSERNLIALRDWVDLRLRPQLLTIEGVASVDVSGGLQREIQVTLNQERLRSYGIAVSEVLNALRAANQDVAAGNVTSSTFDIIGKTSGRFRTLEDVRNVLLSLPGGRQIPLSDVASVADTNREQRLWSRLDGVPAVKLSVRKQPDANTVRVATQVGRVLDRLRAERFIPDDVAFNIIADQAFFITNSVKSVLTAALLGGSLAMIIVLLFLGSLRKTAVVGIAIPIAVLATFAMMGAADLSLNIMSLGGLALGVGMLLDNAIVMLENIFRHRSLGNGDAVEAAHTGAGEVTSAVVAATLTNLAAVIPFLLITGLAALIFRELILTISFAIIASLGVALTLVPMLSAQTARLAWSSGIGKTRPFVAFNRLVERGTDGYRWLVGRVVRRPATVLLTSVALLAACYYLVLPRFGSEFLPTVDDGNVGVFMRLPPGTSPVRTNELALRIEEEIRGMPHVQNVFTTAGGNLFGSSTVEQGGRGSMTIVLDPAPDRPQWPAVAWVAELQRRLDAMAVPGARIFARPPRIRGLRTNTADADVAVTLQGDDLREMERLSVDVVNRLRGLPGIESVQPNTEEASPQVSITVDRERAADMGLDVAAVGQTVRTALDGAVPTRFQTGSQEYDIRVRLPREQLTNVEDLGSIAMFSGRDRPVYLRDVATIRLATGPTSINRQNQNRIVRITADVNTDVATVGEAAATVRSALRDMPLPEGMTMAVGGEEEAIRENQRNLMIVILLAVFLVFVVLAVQYESVKNPLVILVAVPLSLVGVTAAIWITGLPLSAPVMLGVVLLAGIVVNNAILLVEYVELARKERGATPVEAVIEAGTVRLRPILMTTSTTVLGMSPLAVGMGQGSELMRPLAVTVVGGLLVGMVLTLFVVPCAYLVISGLAERLAAWLTGGARAPETRTEG
ncbi:MAG: efflux RND transporter permease subunit [Gemmatimonadales bacterium]